MQCARDSSQYLEEIFYFGFKGFSEMSDEQLIEDYRVYGLGRAHDNDLKLEPSAIDIMSESVEEKDK